MRLLVWAEDARNEFREAIMFIAKDNPTAARQVRDRINDAALLLQQRPIGRQGRVTGTYEKSVSNAPYIVAYALSDEAVTILRVIHTSRDWQDEEWPD